MHDERLIELESKISHQEFQIEKLLKLVQEQELVVYHLENKVTLLEKKFSDFEGAGNEIGPANQKPPHY